MGLKDDIITVKRLLYFLETAKNGQINSTAAKNGLKQSNLSNSLKELEDSLNVQLFNRHNNGVTLTEAGKNIFEVASQVKRALYKIKSYTTVGFQISGMIRLWVSDGIASGYVSETLPSFYEKYPDVCIDIKCTIDAPALSDEADIFLVYEKPQQSDAVILSQNNLTFGLFASTKYLGKYGYPKNINDLTENHNICTRDNFCNTWSEWQQLLEKSKHISVQTNSSSMLMQVTKDGIGIGLHPLGLGQKEESLVHLPKPKFKLQHPFWLVSRKNTKDIPKVRALIDHISEAIKNL